MADYATILVDDQGPVARITLNRPDKRNPIDAAMCGELVHAFAAVKANVIMLTGKKLSAADALACGLVTRVVPVAELEAETMKLANELAERSPATLALGLRAFYRSQDMDLRPALEHLQGELGRVLALEDARE